ncbi:hypothetical protein M2352_003138 [Azospirillum fermentarium]|uniref:hypothetical protein n=1 Tax=Azospirillum fermentarium TaxID=1233114 RepID=UPI00222731AB|nr:hypothetical protein [Azospirillum fermentarium]MCW2247504.1 hypothetical protein [Azospirillum fermentarium]
MNVAIATWAAPSASAVMTARSGGSPADEGAGTGTMASASPATAAPGGAVPITPAAVETPSPIGASAPDVGEGGKDDPLVNRYPRIGVSFNSEASRLIILFRDPTTGQAIDQIPSEVALKQYIDAQQKEKAAATPRYDTVVGATPSGNQADGSAGTAGAVGGQTGSPGYTGDAGAARSSGSGTHSASLRLAAVNGSLPAAVPTAAFKVQAPAGGAVHGGASPGLNLTI